MTNVLKSYHLFCIFLLYVGRLSPTSSKTDVIKLCVIVFSSHYHIFQPVKMLNCFADSIMKTYFDRYVQSTPIRKPHISEITGSCCLLLELTCALNTFAGNHRQEQEFAIDPDVADSTRTVDIVGIPVDSEFGLKAPAAPAFVGVDCAVFFAAVCVCASQGPHPTMQA